MHKADVSRKRSLFEGLYEGLAPLLVAFATGILLYAWYRQSVGVEKVTGWQAFLYQLMTVYLIFLSVRTAVMVLLSFADRFFQPEPRLSGTFPLVSVIVPCFNEETVLEQAVESILKLDYPNFEIIVVDDGSSDLTLSIAEELRAHRQVRVIHQRNQGKAEALNRGISEAFGEFVLCVDADSVLDPQVIRYGLPYFDKDPRLSAVAGSVQVGNSGKGALTRFQRLEYVVGLNFHKSAQSFLSSVTIVPGPVGLFRRETILDVGGYRSGTFAEDCDLTIRMLMQGYRITYCSRMVAVTEAPEDFESLMKQRYRWSRGTLQAIKSNLNCVIQPRLQLRNLLILSYMILETLVIPSANFLFAMVFIQQAATLSHALILGPYFIQLTLLDVVLISYSVLCERQAMSLVALAFVNRLTYGLSMETLRFFSILDELAGLPMSWGKLQRKGL